MKRLALGVALAALCASGCDDKKGAMPPPPPMSGRSNAVTTKDTGGAVAPASTAPASAVPAAQKAPRQLCAGQSPRALPKASFSARSAPGTSDLASSPPIGVGKWVWLNMWAAWCAPCKEEMPRLLGWKDKLAKEGVLIDFSFVSLDDDERQLGRFLESQPAGGVKASYWLPEGEGRNGFLSGLGLKSAPELPVQVLLRPDGQVACVIQGAVEDGDYPAIAAMLKR